MPAIFLFLSSIVGPLAAKVLTALGIGAVSYVGITALLSNVKSYLISQIGGSPPEVLAILGMLKADVAINIVLSAVTARAIISGMNKNTGTKTGLGSIKTK
jgi:hypothetical protein